MGDYPKIDYPPLLAPGRHYMTLQRVKALAVHPFSGPSRARRELLYYALEDFVQRLLVARVRCDVFTNGSFLTKKEIPDDVDVIVLTDYFEHENTSEENRDLLYALNDPSFVPNVQACSMVSYPRGHERFGSAADGGNAGENFGIEHGQEWLKGYVVIRVWETDVGNRICR